MRKLKSILAALAGGTLIGPLCLVALVRERKSHTTGGSHHDPLLRVGTTTMSTFQVLVRRVSILPHPNADRLDLAQVDDFRCVVGKGLYQSGDLVAYAPEQSILPAALVTELELDGNKLGSGNRVKPVRLRGELSQGVCIPARPHWTEGMDVTEELGIVKWSPEVPKVLAGNVRHLGTEYTVAYDVENVKAHPNELVEGEDVVMTEKLHGTFTQFILAPTRLIEPSKVNLPPGWEPAESAGDPRAVCVDGQALENFDEVVATSEAEVVEAAWQAFKQAPFYFAVTSKGVGGKGNVLKLEDPKNAENAYVKMAKELDMKDRMLQVFKDNDVPVIVCGELFGPGIQDLRYGQEQPVFRVFDIYIGLRSRGRFLNDDELTEAVTALGLERVPVLYRGPFSRAKMLELTDGKETISGGKHIREGVVVRPVVERKDRHGGRVQYKSVSADYLTRKGGTEHN